MNVVSVRPAIAGKVVSAYLVLKDDVYRQDTPEWLK